MAALKRTRRGSTLPPPLLASAAAAVLPLVLAMVLQEGLWGAPAAVLGCAGVRAEMGVHCRTAGCRGKETNLVAGLQKGEASKGGVAEQT